MKEYFKRLMGCSVEYESHINNIVSLASKHLPSFRPNNLLDVGCGDGSRTICLARHFMVPEDQTYGLDFRLPQEKHYWQLFNSIQSDLESESLPYPDQTFSLVVCNQVLEHLKNYDVALLDVIRVTKSGGYIIVGIPNLAHLINRFLLILGKQPMCIDLDSSHVRGFTHQAFEKKLKSMRGATYVDCMGSELIYPLPLPFAKPLSGICVGFCAYICYLIRKQ